MLDELLASLGALPEEEKKAIVADALKATEDHCWVPNPGPQLDAYLSEADELFYGGQAGGGKLLDDNTPVPVPLTTDPSGFKRHGDLRPGDEVFSPSGAIIRVVALSAPELNPDAYEVEFDTGEVIVADGQHLWHTWTDAERDRVLRASEEWRAKRRAKRPSRAVAESKKPWVSKAISAINRAREHDIAPPHGGVRTTLEIRSTLRRREIRSNHSVDVCQPIEPPAAELPIEPYLFGLWIGDGYSKNPVIGMAESDWNEIVDQVPEADSVTVDTRPPRKVPFVGRRFSFMLPLLRDMGVFGAKRIPPAYLRASRDQRIALLQGICDTDGTCSERGQIEVGFSNEALAGDLHELVSSLGLKSTLRRKEARDQNGRGRTHWRIKFVAPFPVFRLSRKADRQKLSDFRLTVGRRYIVDVRPAKPVPMHCIKVSAEDGLYLVGRSFITTHNSDLLIGLGLSTQQDSLILRRVNDDAKDIAARAREIAGEGAGYNGQDKVLTLNGRKIRFAGCQYEEDKERFKGRAKDFYGFDEISDFTRSQFKFITTWNRSTKPGQRCRVVCAGNPPTRPEGLWVIKYWAPWLDAKHPNPAKPGELRWFVTGEDDEDLEVDGPGPHHFPWAKKPLKARSRTFIPAKLSDNPDLARTDYEASLDNLPAHLRAAYRDGNFQAELRDDEFQVIPTAWILAAMERWKPDGHQAYTMTAIACDAAGGGADAAVIAARHGGWYAPLVSIRGPETADANVMAGRIIMVRRHDCPVVLDTGGGYGGSYALRLRDNGIEAIAFNGAAASSVLTQDGSKLSFANKRAEVWWRFREALDPAQEGGSVIALPPDDELKADLAAVHFEITRQGILLERKDDIKKRIGRSPDKGDTVTMALSEGDKAVRRSLTNRSGRPLPKVNLGHSHAKRRRS